MAAISEWLHEERSKRKNLATGLRNEAVRSYTEQGCLWPGLCSLSIGLWKPASFRRPFSSFTSIGCKATGYENARHLAAWQRCRKTKDRIRTCQIGLPSYLVMPDREHTRVYKFRVLQVAAKFCGCLVTTEDWLKYWLTYKYHNVGETKLWNNWEWLLAF